MLNRVVETVQQIRPYLRPTPLVRSLLLSKHFDIDLWLKLETESPVGSFKARGALRCLMERSKEGHREFTTASTGNHGMAVAYAGRQLGLPTHVFVPKSGTPRKIALIGEYTRNLHLTDCDFDSAKEMAANLAREKGFYFIDDGGEYPLVEGTATIGWEILNEMKPDAVVVPVGNGALISGIGLAVKAISPHTRVIGVQPEQAPTMYLSWKEKRAVTLDSISTVADGLASRVAVPAAVEMMTKVVDEMVLVSEEAIMDSLKLFVRSEARVIEPSSAAALAALAKLDGLRARKVVAIMTGRNYEIL